MILKINEIPPEGLAINLSRAIDLLEPGVASTTFTASLHITAGGAGNLHVTGRIQAEPRLECSRCLAVFPYAIDAALDLTLEPLPDWQAGAEHELARNELDTEFYQGDELDLVALVREQVLIAVPMVPLHRPDCKGLCSVCGADRNVTECGHGQNGPAEPGPFAGLKDLLKKKS